MKFVFTDKKVTLPQKVHDYAEKKVGKLDRYFKSDAEAFVTFSVEKNRNKVELTVHAGSMYFRADESSSDMFASIDTAVSSIERQIRKNKTRLSKRLRTDAFERAVEEQSSFVPDEPEEEFKVIRTKKFPIKPMTVDEAILQMNLLEHTFFAFRNEDAGGAFAVVYARNDGGYGLIEDAD
ncbi:MAG: ribosome-associated translation inhibitor RaiA [Oscillospiraceae bacterium]|nr:ribosome-associated translation inhibitor RaiA [Oscillospiraceae bacterium]